MIPIIAAGDLSESFQKMIGEMFIRVDGCLVEKTRTGFIIFGTEVKTIDEVKEIISQSARALNNSIR